MNLFRSVFGIAIMTWLGCSEERPSPPSPAVANPAAAAIAPAAIAPATAIAPAAAAIAPAAVAATASPASPQTRLTETIAGTDSVVCQFNEDINQDGSIDRIHLTLNSITFNSNKYPLTNADTKSIKESYEITCDIVDFNPQKPGKQLQLIINGAEDSAQAIYWRFDSGTPFRVLGNVFANHLSFDNGVLIGKDSNCGEPIVTKWTIQGENIVQLSKSTKGSSKKICAACPFVYVFIDGRWQFVGEILRNLRARSMQTWQSLTLPAAANINGHVRVRIAEYKPETTYLDALHVTVANQKYNPNQFQSEVGASDHQYLTINRQDSHIYEFDIPAGTTPVLWADGYYIPN